MTVEHPDLNHVRIWPSVQVAQRLQQKHMYLVFWFFVNNGVYILFQPRARAGVRPWNTCLGRIVSILGCAEFISAWFHYHLTGISARARGKTSSTPHLLRLAVIQKDCLAVRHFIIQEPQQCFYHYC